MWSRLYSGRGRLGSLDFGAERAPPRGDDFPPREFCWDTEPDFGHGDREPEDFGAILELRRESSMRGTFDREGPEELEGSGREAWREGEERAAGESVVAASACENERL